MVRLQSISALFLLSTIILLLGSCKEGELKNDAENLFAIVTNSSGDDFSYNSEAGLTYFAPYPFNVGYIGADTAKIEVMIISKKLKKGDKIEILPLAKLSISDFDKVQKDIFVAVPRNPNKKIFQGETFSDFTVEHFSYKQIVEFWYSNRYGLQGTSIDGWTPTSIEQFNSLD